MIVEASRNKSGNWSYDIDGISYRTDASAIKAMQTIDENISPATAKGLLSKACEEWQESQGTSKMPVDLSVKVLTAQDRKLLEPVKGHLGSDGEMVWLVLKNKETNTYRICNNFRQGMLLLQNGTSTYFDRANEFYRKVLSSVPADQFPPLSPVRQHLARSKEFGLFAKRDLHFSQYLEDAEPWVTEDPEFRVSDLKPMSNDPAVPNLMYFNLNDLAKGDCDSWEQFELHFDKNAVKPFRAWIASIFVEQCRDSRVLYLVDKGGGGKGTIINVLSEVIGDAAGTFDSMGMRKEFAGSEFVGKRLMIEAENKNPNLLSFPLIHKVTTGDVIRVEAKNKDAYAMSTYCRVIVGANALPKINISMDSDRRRLFLLELKPYPVEIQKKIYQVDAQGNLVKDAGGNLIFKGNSEFPKALRAEWPAYLAHCMEAYKECCPDHANIQLPVELMDRIYTVAVDETTVSWSEKLEAHIEFGEHLYCSRSKFWDRIVALLAPRKGQEDNSGGMEDRVSKKNPYFTVKVGNIIDDIARLGNHPIEMNVRKLVGNKREHCHIGFTIVGLDD